MGSPLGRLVDELLVERYAPPRLPPPGADTPAAVTASRRALNEAMDDTAPAAPQRPARRHLRIA